MRSLYFVPVMLLLAGCATDMDDDDTDAATIESVTVTESPDSGAPGETVEICWDVDGEGEIPHTAVHYDTESHSGDNVTFGDYSGGAAYPGGSQSNVTLPDSVCADLDLPDEETTLYFRAHAMIDAPGMLSSEHEITVEEEGGLPIPPTG